MMLLVGDEGYLREEDLLGVPSRAATRRVVLDAGQLSRRGRSRPPSGRRVLLPPRHFHLAVAAFLLGDDAHDWAETRLAFDEAVTRARPRCVLLDQEGHRCRLRRARRRAAPRLAAVRAAGVRAGFTRFAPGLIHSAARRSGSRSARNGSGRLGGSGTASFPSARRTMSPSDLGQLLAALGRPDEGRGRISSGRSSCMAPRPTRITTWPSATSTLAGSPKPGVRRSGTGA